MPQHKKLKKGAAKRAHKMHKKIDKRFKGGIRKSGLKIKSGPTKGRPRSKGKK